MSSPFYFPDVTEGQQQVPHPEQKQSRLSGFGASLQEGLAEGPTSVAFSSAYTQALEQYNPGEFVPSSDIPAHFKELYPNGAPQNILDEKQDEMDAELIRQNKMANVPPGVFSEATNWVGSMVGSLLDPANLVGGEGASIAASWGASKLRNAVLETSVAKGASPTVKKIGAQIIGEGAAGRASGVLPVAATGFIAGGEMTAAQLAHHGQLGQETDPMDILTGATETALTFGTIRAGWGAFRVFHPATPQVMLNTAVNQMAKDKQVNVAPIMQQDIHQSVKEAVKEGRVNPDFVKATSDQLSAHIGTLDKAISESKIKPNSLLGLSRLNEALDISKKLPIENTAAENERLLDIQKLDYMKEMTLAASKGVAERTKAETEKLQAFIENPGKSEKQFIAEESSSYREQLAATDLKIEELSSAGKDITTENFSKLQTLGIRKNHLEEKLRSYEERASELSELHKDEIPLNDHDHVNRMKVARNMLDNDKATHDAILAALDVKPISMADIQNQSARINSTDGDAFINKSAQDQIKMEAEKEPYDGDHYKKIAKDYAEKGKIPKDILEEHERLSREEDAADQQIKGVLEQVKNCLLGE